MMSTKLKERKRTLRGRITGMVALCMILLAVVNILTGVFASYNGLLMNVDKDLNSISQMADVAVSKTLENLSTDGREAASINCAPSNKNLQKQLTDFCKAHSFDGAAVVSASGTAGICTDDDLKSMNYSEDSYFKQALQSQQPVVGTTVKASSGGVFIPVYTAVNNGQSVLVLRKSGTYFSDALKKIVVGDSGNVFVVDKEGTMVANIRPELVSERENFINDSKSDSSKATAAKVYSEMIAGKSGIDKYSYQGVKRVCAYRPLTGGNGWSIGAVAPIKEMTSSIGYTVLLMVTFVILCTLICIAVTVKTVNKITKPITDCAERLTLLSDGDLHSDVPTTDATDETGILLTQLQLTIDRLKKIVGGINTYLTEISKGNLSLNDPPEYDGDFTEISKSIRTILGDLNQIIEQINQSSSGVTSGSEQIAAGAQALSQGATEQASSVEELASTIQEISGQVKKNAENADKASGKTVETSQELERGKENMNQMLDAMKDISNSAEEIRKIIKSIQTIAFQTNILALNAAVEAARAGEAGKGFAVVADEVRNLANKTQEASQETTKMIEHTIASVKSGTEVANKTAESMNQIVESSNISTDLVHKISSASQQQNTAIQQVSQGMDQISSVVQTNSATAEESAAASEELSGQATVLKKLVDYFQIRGDGANQNTKTENTVLEAAPEPKEEDFSLGNDKY